MIRINLLPKDLQSAARTPFILFGTVLAGVAVTGLLVVVYVYLWFNVLVLEERFGRKDQEVKQLEKSALEVDNLLQDIADYKEREKAIISIKTNRILWSRKLEELVELSPPFVWIITMEMRELDQSEIDWKKKEGVTGGFVELVCYSSGDEVERMTFFRQRVKGSDEFYADFMPEKVQPNKFYSDFVNISHPEWKKIQIRDFVEPNHIRFTVRLDLRPLAERPAEEPDVKDAKDPKAAKAAKTAKTGKAAA
jgi:hypothetical protein